MDLQLEQRKDLKEGKCSWCGRKSVFFRKYEGKSLCKNHFCESIEKKVRKTVRKYIMIKSGDKICVAFSGGKDSSVVLYLLHKIVKNRRDIKIFAVSIDEGIAGYRPDSLKIAKKLCENLGIEHHIYSFEEIFGETLDNKMEKIRADPSLKIKESCTFCGVGRRYAMNKFSRVLGATKLATGHNLDDETQAVILNYIRGDLFRASRMGPITDYSLKEKGGELFVPRIKPLREIPEREIGLYALLKGLEVHEDECPYATGIRFEARDFLNHLEDKYPGIKFSILETFEKLIPYIRQFADKEIGDLVLCKICGEPSSHEVCKTCDLWRVNHG